VSSVQSPHGPALREACASCHRADGWKPARIAPTFTHAEKTFPLTGAHARTTCLSCHKRLDFREAQTSCASCHADTHNGELGTTCQRCHNTRSFVDRGAAVRTHEGSRFPLRGAHALATCESCHQRTAPGQQRFLARSATCATCHMDTFQATKAPSHSAAHFSTDCTSCHTISSWSGATFDHSNTKFPLTGRHQLATCASCHADKVFTGKSMACASCHAPDAVKATTPKHDGFAATCQSCHTTTQWAGASFDHDVLTKFPLTGGHRTVTCTQCHADKVYRGKSAACASCHQKDATTVKNPPHAGFPAACESCHSTTKWAGARFDHDVATRFVLTGAHKAVTCAGCHADGVFKGKPSSCASCHQTKYDATTAPHHKEARFSAACESCHTTVRWNGASFDHAAQTKFPLLGRHLPASCLACHSDRVYAGKPSVCQSCHQKDYDVAATPNHKANGFPTTCETCHTATGWAPSSFNHDATGFVLEGAHRTITCAGCHINGRFAGTARTCAGCHQARYDGTANPNHKANGFPVTCQQCHSTTSWRPAIAFDHNLTRFPLTGLHRTVTCESCHKAGVYTGTPTACVSCHQARFDATTKPSHTASAFPTSCQQCHSTAGWTPATFDHNTTAFPLTGQHQAATCASCHADGVFKGKPSSCSSCHLTKYTATARPAHSANGIGTACQQCHSTVGWLPATFDHAVTRFPLAGAHRSVSCSGCHADGVYRGKPTTCVSCHQAKYNATTKPPHASAKIGTACESCHTVTAWTPATFDHNATNFALTGAHRAQVCASCHKNNVYTGTPTTCVGCHQLKYDATTTPNHRASGFPIVCQACHSTAAWAPATFDHNATAFPLTGLHRSVTCASCHGDGVYTGKTKVCSGCHLPKYNATSKPAHQANGIGTTCQTCHSTAGWTPATYDHSVTRFPLAGAHRAVSCAGCHADGVYRGKSMLCSSCHLAKFNATTAPNHRTSAFPTTCETCHSVTAWTPATFNHDATAFPLTGLHRGVTCASCHADGVYKGKPTLCSSCHLTKYNATTKPPHASNGIGTTCQTCHTTNGWTPATYDHSLTTFPLTGAHRTVACAQCHSTGVYRGTAKTCVSCHLTAYNSTTNPNHKTAMFPTVCETCHTTTTWTGATFAHDPWFPIYSGKHKGKWTSCAECHANNANYKEFTCLTCHTKTKTDDQHRGRSGYSYTSPACYSCHPRGSA
jgi:nitrate/TMAO reductase-like tetraheme cytochrome c subunit